MSNVFNSERRGAQEALNFSTVVGSVKLQALCDKYCGARQRLYDSTIMSHTFEVEQKAGYLHIRVSGENAPQTVRNYLKQVYAACDSTKCPRVLIEENLGGPVLPMADIYDIASRESQNIWPVVQQAALVDVNRSHNHDRMEFAETVAVTRGFNLRVFTSIPEAEEWLKAALKTKAPKNDALE
jgi:hypothetical protein